MHTVFVYGTLKKGYGNSVFLRGSKFLGEAISQDSFQMKQVGFPAIFSGNGGTVLGEMYEIDDETLNSLDNLEGNGSMYQREVRSFFLHHPDSPEEKRAWVYIATLGFWERCRNHEDIIPNENGELIWAGRSSATSRQTDSTQPASG